jgi:hypothetical protein
LRGAAGAAAISCRLGPSETRLLRRCALLVMAIVRGLIDGVSLDIAP